MPDINTEEAVRLAAEALHDAGRVCCRECAVDPYSGAMIDARIIVTAALPALAEQFAALIEAEADRQRADYTHDGLADAARLVREAAEVTG